MLGHTTGSHLGQPDSEEVRSLLIWKARVEDGKLACWQLVEDTSERREEFFGRYSDTHGAAPVPEYLFDETDEA